MRMNSMSKSILPTKSTFRHSTHRYNAVQWLWHAYFKSEREFSCSHNTWIMCMATKKLVHRNAWTWFSSTLIFGVFLFFSAKIYIILCCIMLFYVMNGYEYQHTRATQKTSIKWSKSFWLWLNVMNENGTAATETIKWGLSTQNYRFFLLRTELQFSANKPREVSICLWLN